MNLNSGLIVERAELARLATSNLMPAADYLAIGGDFLGSHETHVSRQKQVPTQTLGEKAVFVDFSAVKTRQSASLFSVRFCLSEMVIFSPEIAELADVAINPVDSTGGVDQNAGNKDPSEDDAGILDIPELELGSILDLDQFDVSQTAETVLGVRKLELNRIGGMAVKSYDILRFSGTRLAGSFHSNNKPMAGSELTDEAQEAFIGDYELELSLKWDETDIKKVRFILLALGLPANGL